MGSKQQGNANLKEEDSRVSNFLLGFIQRMAFLLGGALLAVVLKYGLYPYVLLPLYHYLF